MKLSGTFRLSQRSKTVILVVLAFAVLPLIYSGVSIGQDWVQFFRPATLALVHGQNPYDLPEFHNAPWTLIPFIPFALMPYQWGRTGFFLLSTAGFFYLVYKLNAKPISLVLFLTSYPVISCLNGGGIDWLPMLSFVTPAPISLIFAAMKPQIGIGIGLYWLFESWRIGGWQAVIKNFWPVTALLFVSFAFYGFWVMTFLGKTQNAVNISLFPYSLPLAFWMLWIAVRQRRANLAMAAGPFMAPYHTMFSLAAPLVALFDYPKLLAMASACLWLYAIFRLLIFK